MARVAGEFFDLLAEVRPELGHQSVEARKTIRDTLIVDSATMMHGYAALMKDYNDELGTLGTSNARSVWRRKLDKLRSTARYSFNGWNGDLFDKRNPLWRAVGIVKPGRDNVRLTMLNTGAARIECGRVLRQFLAVDENEQSLAFLAKR
jgi:hypothetical protein